MLTYRAADPVLSPSLPGIVPFSANLRNVLALWQSEPGALPASKTLQRMAWRPWLDHGVQFTVLRSGLREPHGFRAAPFGVRLRADIEIDLGPRLLSAESPASFWLNRTVAAEKPLLAYGTLEPIGIAERRGEMLFLPLGGDGVVETILAVIAPTMNRAAPVASPDRGEDRISA